MAEQLEGLLDRLNEEGVKKVEEEQQRMLTAARQEAEEIRQQARDDAEKTRAKTEQELATLRRSAEDNLRQAARDVVISLRDELSELLEETVNRGVRDAMDAEVLGELIVRMAEAYVERNESVSSIEVLLSEEDLEQLEGAIKDKLAERLEAEVTLRPVRSIDAGVQLSFDGQNAYHDVSAEAVTEMLCAYLTPRLVDIIKERGDEAEEAAEAAGPKPGNDEQDSGDQGEASDDKEV